MEGANVAIDVRDTGAGIAAEALPQVFDLFSQVDRTRGNAQGGMGIGLWLVKKLVELHQGSVEARSDGPGQGSTFTVRLPAAME
jgi:signal transduction histidine kinase